MNKNIVLIGFMATGKSLVSIDLAKRLRMKRISTDEWIEQKEKKSVAEIFKISGETSFRQLEAEAVRAIAVQKEIVIDCGGGVVTNPENLKFLKEHGTIFCLTSSPEVILKRTQGKANRPLLNTADPKAKIESLLRERQPFYAQADHTIDTSSHTVAQTVEEILGILKKKQ